MTWPANCQANTPRDVENKCVSNTQTHHTGGVLTGGATVPWLRLHFLKALVELMLNCNRRVTLRLTVFEILFAIKWPKISNLGILGGTAPKKEKICPGPICAVTQNFTPIGATVSEISVTGGRKKTANLVPYHSNVWRVMKPWSLAIAAGKYYLIWPLVGL